MKRIVKFTLVSLLILVGGTALYFWQFGAPTTPQLRKLTDIQLGIAPFKGALTVKTNALLYNPNPFSIRLKKIDLDIFSDDLKISEVNQDKLIKMASKQDSDLPLEFQIPIQSLLQTPSASWSIRLKELLGEQKVNLRIKGNLVFDVAKTAIKVNVNYDYEFRIKDYL